MREETVRFESYDLDASGKVRPSAVLRKMQQAARNNLNAFGITYQEMRERNMAFVVSKIALQIQRPLPAEAPLTLLTAPNPVHGVTFPRSFSISDENGVCVRAMSLWALLDFEKRSLLRASALGEDLPAFPDVSGGVQCERLFRPKDLSPVLTDTRRIYPSMLDQNAHLNNCNYIDLATDLLPEDFGEISEIQITFQHELLCSETCLLEAFSKEEGMLVVGSNLESGAVSFLCQIKKV